MVAILSRERWINLSCRGDLWAGFPCNLLWYVFTLSVSPEVLTSDVWNRKASIQCHMSENVPNEFSRRKDSEIARKKIGSRASFITPSENINTYLLQ